MVESGRAGRGRRLSSLVLVVLILAGGVVAFLALAALREDPERTHEGPLPLPVRCVPATPVDWQEILTVFGQARALRRAEVAAEVTGVVLSVAPGLEAGRAVEAGDVLVRLDPKDLDADLLRAQAERGQAEARLAATKIEIEGLAERVALAERDLATSRAELSRFEDLVEQEILSLAVLDRQRIETNRLERVLLELRWEERGSAARRERDEADVRRAEAVATQAEIQRARAEVRAPFAGLVEQRLVAPGARVAPGTPLFELVDVRRVEVPLRLPATRFVDVRPGAAVRLETGGDGATALDARIARVAPGIDAGSRTFGAYVEFENDPAAPRLPPGAFVTARVHGRTFDHVIAVPRLALIEGELYVAVPGDPAPADGGRDAPASGSGPAGESLARAQRRRPTFRAFLPDVALAEVGSEGGLTPGEWIVVTNVDRVAEGALLRKIEGAPPALGPPP